MGSVSSPALAVAVAEAGAVGSLSMLGLSPASVARQLDEAVGRTTGVIAANFLTASLNPAAVAAAAERVRLIDFFWNEPDPQLIELAHQGGARVSWQVGSVEEARAAEDGGADVVVVQGQEAGGHVRAGGPLLPLLAEVLDVVRVPVLAAGGIGHPRALTAVLAAGAAGARVGTVFIATDESGAHPAYRDAVVQARPGDSVITDTFANGCPLCATSPRHRVLASCVAAAQLVGAEVVGEMQLGNRLITVPKGSPLSPTPTTTGHVEGMALYASDAAASVTKVRPAAEVVAWLCESGG